MKLPATVITLALLTGACATQQPERLDYNGSARFVAMPQALPSSPESKPAGVDWYGPGGEVEPMPFGESMHGPWDMDQLPSGAGSHSFVRKDIHTVMHYIALKSGLQIIVQGDIDVKVTTMLTFSEGVDPKKRAKELIRSIAKANGLEVVEDGEVVIIKERVADTLRLSVHPSEFEGRCNVRFENHDLVAAIVEVARVMGVNVFVPSRASEPDSDAAPRESVRVSLSVDNATPDHILRELARRGGLEVRVMKLDDDDPNVGYRFTYKD